MKRKIILLTSLALLLQTTCSAAEIKVTKNVDEGSYIVSGTFEEAKVNRSVGIKIEDEATPTPNLKYAVGVPTDENGTFSKKITLKGSTGFTGGYYSLEAAAYDSSAPISKRIYFATDAEINAAMSAVNDPARTSVTAAIDAVNSVSNPITNDVVFGLDNSYYTAATKTAIDAVLDQTATYATATELSNKFYDILACVALSQAAESGVKAVTNEFDYVFNFDTCTTYPLYKKLLAKDADVIDALYGTNKTTAADVRNAFNEKILLEGVATATKPGEAQEVYDTYSSFFNFTPYTGWDSAKIASLTAGKTYASYAKLYEYLGEQYSQLTPQPPIIVDSSGPSAADSIVSAPATPPTAEIDVFSDLGNHPWAKDAITRLYQKGVVAGSEGKYEPARNVKREEFVIMILKAFGLFEEGYDCNFDDVPKDHWAYQYIACAYQKGIISGISDTTFGLGVNISREDMAVIIKRAANISGAPMAPKRDLANFTDAASISAYAKDAVEEMYCAKIISGFDDGSFKPKNNATRAEAAVMLNNTL